MLDKQTRTLIAQRLNQAEKQREPVSYTHLDVYKRQDQRRHHHDPVDADALRLFRHLLGKGGGEPVSYTHLAEKWTQRLIASAAMPLCRAFSSSSGNARS